MNDRDLAAALHGTAFLRDVNTVESLAALARVPTSVVIDALLSGELQGRQFPGLGWRVTKRAALAWFERKPAGEATRGE